MDSPLYNRRFIQHYQPKDYYHLQDSIPSYGQNTRTKHDHNDGISIESGGLSHSLQNGNTQKFSNSTEGSDYTNGSKQKRQRQKTIWDVLGTFAGVTSLQGVPYIQKANRWWSTVFWIVAFLVGLGFMGFHSYYLINLFRQNEVTTKITLGYQYLEFPSITICNMNPFMKNKIDNTSLEMKQFLENIHPEKEKESRNSTTNRNAAGFGNPRPNDPNKKFALSESESTDHTNLHEFLELYGELSVPTRREVGQRSDVFIQECSFNGYECTYRDFNHHLSPMYGNCWTFNDAEDVNSTSSLVSYLPGKEYGLNLRLYIEEDQYLPGVSEDVGVVVAIHEYGTMSFPEQSGISVPTGMTTLIGVKLINITRLGDPYTPCRSGSQFLEDPETKYTREACIATCVHIHISDRCNCYLAPYEYYYPKIVLKNPQKCGEDEEKCVDNIMTNVANGVLGCGDCISGCHDRSYDKLTSASRWPQESYYSRIVDRSCEVDQRYCQALRENTSKEIPKNFVNLKIYFRELNFENIEEQPSYELVQFVSDVGGVLGLWVGISVLSIVELIQLIFELINFGCKKHCFR